jgi:two-component system nitrogen regulation response regulator GlnG
MAPGQVIDAKDLPPELQVVRGSRRQAEEPAAAAQAAVPVAATSAPVGSAPMQGGDGVAQPLSAPAPVPVPTPWLSGLERDARLLLEAGEPMVWETMTRKFEAQLIHTALEITRGRRIEAAQKLGIGRNTITRKIQELGLED